MQEAGCGALVRGAKVQETGCVAWVKGAVRGLGAPHSLRVAHRHPERHLYAPADVYPNQNSLVRFRM